MAQQKKCKKYDIDFKSSEFGCKLSQFVIFLNNGYIGDSKWIIKESARNWAPWTPAWSNFWNIPFKL